MVTKDKREPAVCSFDRMFTDHEGKHLYRAQ